MNSFLNSFVKSPILHPNFCLEPVYILVVFITDGLFSPMHLAVSSFISTSYFPHEADEEIIA